jgi:Secretion system C-terminal sorting domain
MKEIVILLVTFLGICKGFAQSPASSIVPDSLKMVLQKIVPDSVALKKKAAVKLFPNPAKNRAELQVSGFEAGTVQLQIIDLSGKKLRNEERFLLNGTESIVIMFSLQPGIYFITVKQKDTWIKKKMMVQ